MAWGRKARRIAQFKDDMGECANRILRAEGDLRMARDKAQWADQRVAELEASARSRRQALAEREQEVRDLKDRQRELEWAVHLLNRVLANKSSSSLETPLTGVTKATIEIVREAVRERDIVVKWDDLEGTAEVHFPKKDERRAPWARATGGLVPLSAADLIYTPSVSDRRSLSSIIKGPA